MRYYLTFTINNYISMFSQFEGIALNCPMKDISGNDIHILKTIQETIVSHHSLDLLGLETNSC